MEPEVAFGRVLRELRLQRGISQEALALDAGVQRNYVSLLERGHNAASVKIIFKLAPVLKISVAEWMANVESLIKAPTRLNSNSNRRRARLAKAATGSRSRPARKSRTART